MLYLTEKQVKNHITLTKYMSGANFIVSMFQNNELYTIRGYV